MLSPEDVLNEPFIMCHDRIYTGFDFAKALKRGGVKTGDTICVQSQIYSLGRSMLKKDDFLSTIISVLKYVIGTEGTLLMPAFSYSFCKGEDYNVQNTPSDVGILTEFFRKMSDVYRTKHPIFSFAVCGKRAEEFLSLPISSFNESSVYGHMILGNDKLIFLGAPVGYTFYYAAEEYVQVSHRFYKNFEGNIINGNKRYTQVIPYYVRHLDRRSTESERKINNYLFENGFQKKIEFGKGNITVAESAVVFAKLVDKLRDDEEFFLRDREDVL
ncbi:SPBc2 prophage-derived aminoglycoside N(3')-acetyltransferase-like protein YokD [Lachnospiraceae bacterium]|nr:SPBc2 prophage-derived aminoglycoside N(3')-acetyltransferase-like protein YokD [Lachnospiraceae bacterium]GFI70531.1 SPBc2 prophage-derived aminoglycoside N(3')-acetyltransferase-like protein YokD [Lachnospiraceae bacterium]